MGGRPTRTAEPEAVPELLSLRERRLLGHAFDVLYHLTAAGQAARRPPRAAPTPVLTSALAWAEREQLASSVGRWIRRSLAGESPAALGPSRREQQPLRSRIWVCFADRDGTELSPVLVALTWTTVVTVAGYHRTAAPRAVTVGWPSQREARLCVAAAGCRWPAEVLP